MKKNHSIKYQDLQNWPKRPRAIFSDTNFSSFTSKICITSLFIPSSSTLAQKWRENYFNYIFMIIFWKTLYNMLKNEMNTPFRHHSFLLGSNKPLYQVIYIPSINEIAYPNKNEWCCWQLSTTATKKHTTKMSLVLQFISSFFVGKTFSKKKSLKCFF